MPTNHAPGEDVTTSSNPPADVDTSGNAGTATVVNMSESGEGYHETVGLGGFNMSNPDDVSNLMEALKAHQATQEGSSSGATVEDEAPKADE